MLSPRKRPPPWLAQPPGSLVEGCPVRHYLSREAGLLQNPGFFKLLCFFSQVEKPFYFFLPIESRLEYPSTRLARAELLPILPAPVPGPLPALSTGSARPRLSSPET